MEYDPADADNTAYRHQVSLIEGENVITVTVTSADRSTTSTHTITVTRPSAATQPSNSEPTGVPTIAGTAWVGETLSASVSEITDADGLGGATFTYQWIRSDGTTDTEIADATQASYTLVPTDQGKTIKVRATFTDDGGTEEALTSAATAVVQDSLLLSVSDASATEGALVEFTVSLSAASGQQVTVQYATADGTAESGADFTPASGTLTFAANETSKSVYVATGRDAVDEENETFTLRLSNASGATISNAEATGTIVNDDEPEDTVSPTVSLQCVDIGLQKEEFASIWWEMHFSEPVRGAGETGAQHFEIAGQDDTDFSWFAIGGPDARGLPGPRYSSYRYATTPRVRRPDGLPSAVVSDVNGVVINVPAGGWQDMSGNLNTASANALYLAHNWKVSAADASATEGTDGTIDFEVTLNARDDCETVTVDWATADGTATAGEDYTAASGTLTFGPGETSKTVSVEILEDTVEDRGETFTLRLSNASAVTIDDGEATGTISDEESPFVSVPQIDGIPQVGNTLEVSFAEPASGALAYQWLRGSEVIAGATASTYVPTVADVGARLSVRLDREPRRRVGVAHAAADLDARAGLGIPAVMAQPELQRRPERRAIAHVERAPAFERNPHPARNPGRAALVRDRLGFGLDVERVRLEREVDAAGLVRLQERAPAAHGGKAHLQVGPRDPLGLAAVVRRLHDRHVARAPAGQGRQTTPRNRRGSLRPRAGGRQLACRQRDALEAAAAGAARMRRGAGARGRDRAPASRPAVGVGGPARGGRRYAGLEAAVQSPGVSGARVGRRSGGSGDGSRQGGGRGQDAGRLRLGLHAARPRLSRGLGGAGGPGALRGGAVSAQGPDRGGPCGGGMGACGLGGPGGRSVAHALPARHGGIGRGARPGSLAGPGAAARAARRGRRPAGGAQAAERAVRPQGGAG